MIFAGNNNNIYIVKLCSKYFEACIELKDILEAYSKSTTDEKNRLYSNTSWNLEKQCEVFYDSIIICLNGNFKQIISNKTNNMKTSEKNKKLIQEFLLQLLSNKKLDDLSYLLALLPYINIIEQNKFIIKEYIPGTTTIAAADTTFYFEEGIIGDKEKLILNPEKFLITIWSKLDDDMRKETIVHELTHIIIYPRTHDGKINNNQEQEDKVDEYLKSLQPTSNIEKDDIIRTDKTINLFQGSFNMKKYTVPIFDDEEFLSDLKNGPVLSEGQTSFYCPLCRMLAYDEEVYFDTESREQLTVYRLFHTIKSIRFKLDDRNSYRYYINNEEVKKEEWSPHM